MNIIPIKWSFQRKNILPILEVIGESSDANSKCMLLNNAVKIIDEAGNFQGVPYNDPVRPNSNQRITVYFSLIFPNEIKFNSFMDLLKKGDLLKKN